MEFQTLKATKPTVIHYALIFLWAGLGLGAASAILYLPNFLRQGMSLQFFIFAMSFIFGPYAVVVWAIGEGKNWARITHLAIWLLFTLNSGLRHHDSEQLPVTLVVLGLGSNLAQIVGMVMIFIGPGRHWFTSERRLIVRWK